MKQIRQEIGGLGNLLFKQAYLLGKFYDGEIPDIYLQSPKYWEKHADKIKAAFSADNIGTTDAVSLHIRRGDYLHSNFYVHLFATNYYKKAIKLFPDDTEFLVFCKDGQNPAQDAEDRTWATHFMTALVGDRWEFARYENTPTDDLNLMASCKGNIMANSSFSWWGAFLNNNPDRKVVAPREWFSDKVQRVGLLEEWIQI